MKKKKVDAVKQAALARQDAARMEQMSQATSCGSWKLNEAGSRTARKAKKGR